MRLWCYDDAHYWGCSLHDQALARGWEASLFDNHRQPTDGKLFFHMHSHPSVRVQHKRMMQHFATIPMLKTTPSYRESVVYDDKLEQLRQFASHIPPTKVFRTPAMAREYIETMPPLPIISKSSEGGGVRTLRTYDDMRREIKLAFSDLGIKNKYGSRHHSYLYWQSFVADVDHVIRVARIGSSMIMLRRGKRINMERKITPVVDVDEPEAASALYFAKKFFDAYNLHFGAVDVIKNAEGSWFVLKYTASWAMRLFHGSKFEDGRDGFEMTAVVLDEIELGNI